MKRRDEAARLRGRRVPDEAGEQTDGTSDRDLKGRRTPLSEENAEVSDSTGADDGTQEFVPL